MSEKGHGNPFSTFWCQPTVNQQNEVRSKRQIQWPPKMLRKANGTLIQTVKKFHDLSVYEIRDLRDDVPWRPFFQIILF